MLEKRKIDGKRKTGAMRKEWEAEQREDRRRRRKGWRKGVRVLEGELPSITLTNHMHRRGKGGGVNPSG